MVSGYEGEVVRACLSPDYLRCMGEDNHRPLHLKPPLSSRWNQRIGWYATASHAHSDHNNVAAVKRNPEVVRERKSEGIDFKAIPAYHDTTKG